MTGLELGRAEIPAGRLPDITVHPTKEGKVYCAAILDVFCRCRRRIWRHDIPALHARPCRLIVPLARSGPEGSGPGEVSVGGGDRPAAAFGIVEADLSDPTDRIGQSAVQSNWSPRLYQHIPRTGRPAAPR